MKNIEIIVNNREDYILNYGARQYKIGNPEKISLDKSINKGKINLTLMYRGPNIPEEVEEELSEFAYDTKLKPEIMSRESGYLPTYRDVWSAEMPNNFEVNIKYTSSE